MSRTTGLDTTVVVRWLTGSPPNQAAAAKRCIQSLHAQGPAPVVSDLVVAETYYALQYHYAVPKEEAARQLLSFLTSGWVNPPGGAVQALTEASSAGLVDRMIRLQYVRELDEVVTFDTRLARMDRVRVLKEHPARGGTDPGRVSEPATTYRRSKTRKAGRRSK